VQVRDTAAAIIAEGGEVTVLVRRLSILVGAAVALVLLAPLLIAYLPARLLRMRDTRAIRQALHDSDSAPGVDRYLAYRAIAALPLHRLRPVTDDPWRDLSNGPPQRLADAELTRLGLVRHRASNGAGGRR
jgi:hypothetical protein